MQKRGWILFAGVLALAVIKSGLVISNLLAGERLVHTEPPEFAPIVVFEQYGERCMNVNDIEGEGRQTCMQLKDPDRMVFEYTRMMTSALFVNPAPQSILIIGLGGATLPTALHKLLPTTVIDTVEIDPAVVKVAQRYFGYQVGPRQRVHVDDGRAFVERALADGRRYDMVMLDAFDVEYIPAHLLTVECLEHVRSLLSDTGVVVANSFAQSRMYERESATYATVFGEFFNLRAGLEGNRVIVATVGPLPSAEQLEHNARQLAKQLEPFGIDIDKALGAYDVHQEPPGQNLPLRDPPPDGG